MKQMTPTEVTVGDYIYYVKPFPAFVAANISGQLAEIFVPLIGAIAPYVSASDESGEVDIHVGDDKVGDVMSGALKGFSGDKIEKMVKELLVNHNNIGVCGECTEGLAKLLSKDLADEIFCGEIQDMFILCFHVIKLNFKGFFKSLGIQSGSLSGIMAGIPKLTNTESLT